MDSKKDIWDAEEVKEIPYLKKDQRLTPEFEVINQNSATLNKWWELKTFTLESMDQAH